MQTIKITIPDGCEVQIIRKEEKKEPIIRTYDDLFNADIMINGFYIGTYSDIDKFQGLALNENRNIAALEKVAKSMLAMAMISQLMPYYGGEITDEEWMDTGIPKYILYRCKNNISSEISYAQYRYCYHYLSFHTAKQRDEFFQNNEQLVKDYLMLD